MARHRGRRRPRGEKLLYVIREWLTCALGVLIQVIFWLTELISKADGVVFSVTASTVCNPGIAVSFKNRIKKQVKMASNRSPSYVPLIEKLSHSINISVIIIKLVPCHEMDRGK